MNHQFFMVYHRITVWLPFYQYCVAYLQEFMRYSDDGFLVSPSDHKTLV